MQQINFVCRVCSYGINRQHYVAMSKRAGSSARDVLSGLCRPAQRTKPGMIPATAVQHSPLAGMTSDSQSCLPSKDRSVRECSLWHRRALVLQPPKTMSAVAWCYDCFVKLCGSKHLLNFSQSANVTSCLLPHH